MKEGIAPGHNLLVWDKSQGSASIPVPAAVNDTAAFRTSTASMRIAPGVVGLGIRGSPYGGNVGQTYVVRLWVKTDSTWNGTAGNSKIRFGHGSTGALQTACGYDGVKMNWTEVTCSFTLTSAVPSVLITVGNDGTVGNIWLDDFSLTLSE